MSDQPQYKRYTGDTGSLDTTMPREGDYLSVETFDREDTPNRSLSLVFNTICEEAQGLSAHPASRQPEMTEDLMKRCLTGLDRCFARISAEATTRANRIFSNTYGQAPRYSYSEYPIRWPGENAEALNMVLAMVASAHQVVFVPSNHVPRGIFDNHGAIIVLPLFDLKAELMRRWFAIEVKGDISPDELDAMFRDSDLQPPIQKSLTDERDRATDRAAEDARAMGHETGVVPSEQAMDQATTGIEVFQFVPNPGDWAKFAELLKRQEAAGPQHVPVQPFPFSLTTIGDGASGGGASFSGGGSGSMVRPNPTP